MFEPNKEYLYNRWDFERNLEILNELIIAEKIFFNKGLDKTIDSILKVRKLPNGRIDLNTVNELVRLTANMSAMQLNNSENNEEN